MYVNDWRTTTVANFSLIFFTADACEWVHYTSEMVATTSISTRAFLGNVFTATAERAG